MLAVYKSIEVDSPPTMEEELRGLSVENCRMLGEQEGSSLDKVEYKPPVKLKRQGRVSERPHVILKQDSDDRLRQETKLVILEYLSSLPPENISARNRKEYVGGTSVVKAKTIHSSERPFLDVIEKRQKGSITRRNSDEYDARVRNKLNKMATPLREKLTPEILDDIKKFNKCELKTGGKKARRSMPYLR